MRQYKFDIQDRAEALEKLLNYVESYADALDRKSFDIIYELNTHLDSLSLEARQCYQDLVMLECMENIIDACQNDLADYKMGEIYIMGDVLNVDEKIREQLNTELKARNQ